MTIEQIIARLKEIADEIEKMGDSLTPEQMEEKEKEVAGLQERMKTIKEQGEKRSALLQSIANGNVGVTTRGFNQPSAPTPTPTAPAAQAAESSTGETDIYSTVEYRNAFKAYIQKGIAIPAEFRANETTLTTDVSAVIPTTIMNKVVGRIKEHGGILSLITQTNIKAGVEVPVSSLKPKVEWVGENGTSDRQKATPVKGIMFAYHKLRCAISLSLEVTVTSLDIFEADMVERIVAAAIMGKEEAIINGDGNKKPEGILNQTADDGAQIIEVSEFGYDTIMEIEGKIKSGYSKNLHWVMTRQTFFKFLAMTDTVGQPIARMDSGIAGSQVMTLFGRPVIETDYVPQYAEGGVKFAALYDFSDYMLNTNYEMGIKKYIDEETEEEVTKTVSLVDGKSSDNGSLIILQSPAAANPGS